MKQINSVHVPAQAVSYDNRFWIPMRYKKSIQFVFKRRLASLEIVSQRRSRSPINVVDEVERGLEPYSQRQLLSRLDEEGAQTFLTTHSSVVIAAAATASFWYLDASQTVGYLPNTEVVARNRRENPEAFLSKLAIFVEGITEVGFVTELLRHYVDHEFENRGIVVVDGKGVSSVLSILEEFVNSGLRCGGFVDQEGGSTGRWMAVRKKLGDSLFQWKAGGIEQNIIALVPESSFEEITINPGDSRSGERRKTLAKRLAIKNTDFATIQSEASELRQLLIDAATGTVPLGCPDDQKKSFKSDERCWFKSIKGGQELFRIMRTARLDAKISPPLLQFVNAIRSHFTMSPLQTHSMSHFRYGSVN